MDTGSSVGQMIGHSKTVNTIDYKSSRPFRVITASEDYSVGFYEGPPFKMKFTNKVRYHRETLENLQFNVSLQIHILTHTVITSLKAGRTYPC